jgi:hypothetical protein
MSGFGTATIVVANVAANNGPVGKVTSNPTGVDCGNQCDETFTVASVTLTPAGSSGAVFERWSNDGDCEDQGKTVCVLEMDQAVRMPIAHWQLCKPNEFLRCEDSLNIVRCSSDGSGERIEMCPQGVCSIDAQACTECTPGETSCDESNENAVRTCGSDGFFEQQAVICLIGSCVDGACNPDAPTL